MAELSPRRLLQRATLARRARVKDGLASGSADDISPMASPRSPPSEPATTPTTTPPASAAERDSISAALALVGNEAAAKNATPWPTTAKREPRVHQLLSAGVQRRPSLLQFRCERCHVERVSARLVDAATGCAWLVCRRCHEQPVTVTSVTATAAAVTVSIPVTNSASVSNSTSTSNSTTSNSSTTSSDKCLACEDRRVAARVTLRSDARIVRVCKSCAKLASRDAAFAARLERAGLMFGEPLGVVLRREAHAAQAAPLVVLRLASYVVRSGAIKDEGVFRIAGRKDVIDRMQADIERSGAPTAIDMRRHKADPHCVTAVLKAYLRELPEPLLTARLWEPLLAVAADLDDKGVDARNTVRPKLRELLATLPPPNRAVLAVLLFLLSLAIAHSDTTRMSVLNAAICISPTILYEPPTDLSEVRDAAALRLALEPARLAARMAAATRVVACLVRYYHDVFLAQLGDGAEMLRALARYDGEQQLYFGEIVQRLQTRLAADSPPPPAPARSVSAAKIRPALPSKVGVPANIRTPSPTESAPMAAAAAPRMSSWKAASHSRRSSFDRHALSKSMHAGTPKRTMLTSTMASESMPASPASPQSAESSTEARRSLSSQMFDNAAEPTPPAVERAVSASIDVSDHAPLPPPPPPDSPTPTSPPRPRIAALDLIGERLHRPKRVQSTSSILALDLFAGHFNDDSLRRYNSRRDSSAPPTPPPIEYDSDDDTDFSSSTTSGDMDLTDGDSDSIEVHDLDDAPPLPAPPPE